MEKINRILFFVLIGLQIITLLPSKITKIKWQLFLPLMTLPLYIWYESYFLRPEILKTTPIRIDLFILHPLITAAFISSIIRSIFMLKNRKVTACIGLTTVSACFIYFWYHILVICRFYR